jgi:hypothetical protein
MKKSLTVAVLALTAMAGTVAFAGPRDDILQGYADAAKLTDPGFAGFDAARGKVLYAQKFTASPDSESCSSCHTASPLKVGKTRAGKEIAPMAVSITPDRFTDPEKVEKWFGRNCKTVIGRECTPMEKGDFITYLAGL